MWIRCIWLTILLAFALIKAQEQNDSTCTVKRKPGVCTERQNCSSAYQERWHLQEKGDKSCYNSEHVCCVDFRDLQPELTISTEVKGLEQQAYGLISKTKCADYSFGTLTFTTGIRKCGMSTTNTIGERAKTLEFPHMAQLGYQSIDGLRYRFPASLISENFLLTAASPNFLSEKYPLVMARFGTDEESLRKTYEIAEVIVHPNYKKNPINFNIVLIRLKEKVKFTDMIRPACLQTKKEISVKEAIATGWGDYDVSSKISHLLKRPMDIVTCELIFDKYRSINKKYRICADASDPSITKCRGYWLDEILQTENKTDCMHHIVGVTTSEDNCGRFPTVYTRVSEFVPWIESIVWPDYKVVPCVKKIGDGS